MKRTEKFWDRVAAQWDAEGNELEQSSIKVIESTIKYLNSSDIVLDFACGTGNITNEFAEYVKEIHAIDISSGMIDVAKKLADERNIENIYYLQTTIFDERYQNESFDVIMAFSILHLLEDIHKVIHRVNKLLKPGGMFISVSACLAERRTFLGFFLSLLSKTRLVPHINIFKISDFEALIEAGNFKILEVESLQQSPPNCFIAAKKLD